MPPEAGTTTSPDVGGGELETSPNPDPGQLGGDDAAGERTGTLKNWLESGGAGENGEGAEEEPPAADPEDSDEGGEGEDEFEELDTEDYERELLEELGLEKFKGVGDLAKSYKELQKKLGTQENNELAELKNQVKQLTEQLNGAGERPGSAEAASGIEALFSQEEMEAIEGKLYAQDGGFGAALMAALPKIVGYLQNNTGKVIEGAFNTRTGSAVALNHADKAIQGNAELAGYLQNPRVKQDYDNFLNSADTRMQLNLVKQAAAKGRPQEELNKLAERIKTNAAWMAVGKNAARVAKGAQAKANKEAKRKVLKKKKLGTAPGGNKGAANKGQPTSAKSSFFDSIRSLKDA